MIDRVAGGKALPAEVLDEIVAKTDGVPLFVEELTKTVLESGLLREENGAYVLASALTPLAIPSTLQDSLMARLDRLARSRRSRRSGRRSGASSPIVCLERCRRLRCRVAGRLGQLMAAELIYGRGAPPEAKLHLQARAGAGHGLRLVAARPRQRIHADIARALIERFLTRSIGPAIIAHHYTEAGLAEPAARYWLTAAELALSRSAALEADRYVEAGLALIPNLAVGPDSQSLELAL